MKITTTFTHKCEIYMAGDIDKAKEICQSFCDYVGLCVTVTPTDYIYTKGAEAGFIVGLINYARFPSQPIVIYKVAQELALLLMNGLEQQSFTIQDNKDSVWHSIREDK